MRAALGFRAHSGWASLVALGEGEPAPRILLRKRVELVDTDAEGGNQPYHAAQNLSIAAARKLLERSRKRIFSRAESEMRVVLRELEARGTKPAGCGVLTSSSRIPNEVEKILGSHPLLHAAEGALYRDALAEAGTRLGLSVTKVREKEIVAEHARRLGLKPSTVEAVLKTYKKEVGPPFREDERFAALVAWVVLAG